MLLHQQKMCEGCGLKRPTYGLPAERKMRWCAGCAAAEGRGAVSLQQKKKCEDCGVKHSNCWLPSEGRKRWCDGCAKKNHPRAVSSSQKGPVASAPSHRAPTKTRPSKRHKVTKKPQGHWARAVAAAQVQVAQWEASASASGGLVRAGLARDAITSAMEPVEIKREQLTPPPVGSTAVAGGDDGNSDGEVAEILRPAAQPLGAKPSTPLPYLGRVFS